MTLKGSVNTQTKALILPQHYQVPRRIIGLSVAMQGLSLSRSKKKWNTMIGREVMRTYLLGRAIGQPPWTWAPAERLGRVRSSSASSINPEDLSARFVADRRRQTRALTCPNTIRELSHAVTEECPIKVQLRMR